MTSTLKLKPGGPKPAEKEIQTAILEWLELRGALAWQNDSLGVWDPVKKCYRKRRSRFCFKGIADILGIWRGWPLAIEVKRHNGIVSDDQRWFLEQFTRAGGIGFVARSLEEAIIKLMRVTERNNGNENGVFRS